MLLLQPTELIDDILKVKIADSELIMSVHFDVCKYPAFRPLINKYYLLIPALGGIASREPEASTWKQCFEVRVANNKESTRACSPGQWASFEGIHHLKKT